MKNSGNGTPQNCMLNLLRIQRGEVRFDILRGMDTEVIDQPETTALVKMRAEAYWLVSQYEPRVEFNGLEIVSMLEQGNFQITSNATVRENV